MRSHCPSVSRLVYTGLRRGDAVRFGRQHIRNGVGTIRTEKTDTEVTLPILPVLQKTLEASPTGDLTFICGETGKPLTKEYTRSADRRRLSKAAMYKLAGENGSRTKSPAP
jgi:integrase